jgi:hypothetical protein
MKARLFAFLLLATVFGVREASATSIALSLSDGTNSITIFQNGTYTTTGTVSVGPTSISVLSTPTNGVFGIVWNGSIGAWAVNVTTGVGSNMLGPGVIGLNSVNVNTTGPATTLTMSFSQNFNPIPFPGWTMGVGGTALNFSQVSYAAYVSNTNSLFASTTPIGQLSFNTFGPGGAYAGSATGTTPGITPNYSLTQVLSITSTNGFAVSSFFGGASLTPIPEPASLTMLGVGLSGLALLTRRWRKRSKKSDKK